MQDAAIEILTVTPLTNKELCALAFDCNDQTRFPALEWNITIPGSKPTPKPPQPPAVSVNSRKVNHN